MWEQFQLNFLYENFHVMFAQQMSSSRGELNRFYLQGVSFKHFYDDHSSPNFVKSKSWAARFWFNAAIYCVKFLILIAL